MAEVLAVAVLGLVLLAVAGLAAALINRVAGWRTAVSERVLVNLKSGQAVDGVLWTRRGRFTVLRDAQLLEPGAEPVRLDGEVVVDRGEIAFTQVPGTARD